jgi:hypothetical protein
VRSTGWFVHPLNLESGVVDAPYQVSPAQLGSLPEVCPRDAEGYLIVSGPGPDPFASDLPSGMNARGFEGRFRVSALGVCIDSLAAQGEGGPSATKAAAGARTVGRPTVALTLSERRPLGRRVGLACSN